MKFKKLLALTLTAFLSAGMMTGCGGKTEAPAENAEKPETEATETKPEEPAETAVKGKVAMITDVGGVNDQSFNQSAWQGLQNLGKEGVEVSYIESQKEADYAPNLETKINEGNDLVWGVGFMMKEAMTNKSLDYPDQKFALIDDSWPDGECPNVTGVVFAAEQSSFLVGYIASYMTKTNHVGFVLGMESPTMNKFTNGYYAGVQYGAAEQNKKVKIDMVNVESFSDAALGKATAKTMYSDGADIVFHAAGNVGNGVIEAAKDAGKWVIGVDMDQNHLAPDNVITSAMKNVNIATEDISKRILSGEDLGGKTITYTLKEGGVGIAPSSDKLVPAEILEKTKAVEQKIISGEIVVPETAEELAKFGK